ncbi:MAG: hypothetical protein ACI9J3_001455 [Parvicellaceae bacterium]|jgi:hypothetical protein
MKILKCVLIILLFTCSINAMGQSSFDLFDQNKISVGLSAKGGWNSTRAAGGVKVRGSYFIVKKLSLGLEFGYAQNGSFYRHFETVIPVRYNFINRKLSPFTELSFHHFNTRYEGPPGYKGTWHELRIGIGLSYAGALKNKIGFEFSIENKIFGNNPNSDVDLIFTPRITCTF